MGANWLFSKGVIIAIVILIIWLLGGADILFSNPIIIVFAILAFVIMSIGGKRK